jgi:hypothetical protein
MPSVFNRIFVERILAPRDLVRIDTLVPTLDKTIPGNAGWAGLIVICIIMAEVFAIPFALRMRLSTLAHIMSGFQIVFAPLLWSLVTLWAYGTDTTTGQFTSFPHTPSSIWLVLFNIAWLGFGFYALWTLGYNRLKMPRLLST